MTRVQIKAYICALRAGETVDGHINKTVTQSLTFSRIMSSIVHYS